MVCSNYAADQDARFYLNADKNQYGNCPVMGLFHAVRNYTPKLTYNHAVHSKYGLVSTREDGECSNVDSSGPSFDFLVPCQSHDYCYDLRRAGFSETVTDSDCDVIFAKMMDADCELRPDGQRTVCIATSLRYSHFVKTDLLGAAYKKPGLIQLRNVRTNLCITVPNYSKNDGVRVIQQECRGNDNQIFRMHPLSESQIGEVYFTIRPEHSQESWSRTNPSKKRCLKLHTRNLTLLSSVHVVQGDCGITAKDTMKFRLSSVSGNNIYHINTNKTQCLRPNFVSSDSNITSVSCFIVGNDSLSQWRIQNVER